jgi:hypothetical protein
MTYGPRTPEVEAFVASLSGITRDQYRESYSQAFDAVADFPTAQDWATKVVSSAAGAGNEVLVQVTRAENAARLAAAAFGFEGANTAALAAGAIVMLDHRPFGDLAAAFLVFRGTSAILPVRWN